MSKKNCYGHYHPAYHECRLCEIAPWCKDAHDLPLSGHVSFEQATAMLAAQEPEPQSEMRFSLQDLHKMAISLLELPDKRLRTIVRLKLNNPQITLNQIADHFGVTRQAITQTLRRFCTRHQAWESFFFNTAYSAEAMG